MNSNNSYLLKRYALPLLGLAISTIALIQVIKRGEYIVPVVMGSAFAALMVLMWFVRRKTRRFFQDQTPDRAVAYYHRTMPQVKDGPALCAYMCALVYSFYGEYDKARDELGEISWASYPPMYDGFRTYVLSIIALLEKRDTGKALDLAVEARDLCEVAQGMPGAGTAKRTLDAHIHCCELLAGSASETLVSTLESTITKLPSIASFIPIWSLMIYYSSVGNKEASEIKTLKLRRMAPHCKPLLGEAAAPSQGV